MDIITLPVLRDNYIFLLVNPATRCAAVVDPAEAEPVIDEVQKRGLHLTDILNTHHHADHTGGNRRLLETYPGLSVLGGDEHGRIPGQTRVLTEGEEIEICGQKARVLDVHAHTRGHIAYFFAEEGHLFSGDTLFAGTCGAIFEGTLEDMFEALKKIRALPSQTQIWCAHEYTLLYLRDAIRIDPQNPAIPLRMAEAQKKRAEGLFTVPLCLLDELDTNPFLRWDDSTLQNRYGSEAGLPTFAKVAEAAG